MTDNAVESCSSKKENILQKPSKSISELSSSDTGSEIEQVLTDISVGMKSEIKSMTDAQMTY